MSSSLTTSIAFTILIQTVVIEDLRKKIKNIDFVIIEKRKRMNG